MKQTRKKRSGGGTFRFDWATIGVDDESSRRGVRREAARLTSPPDRQRRGYGRAKPLTLAQLDRVISYLEETSRVPESDVLKVRLSYFAGLRACEIAKLRVTDVTNASGEVDTTWICVPDKISKGGRGRMVPMHPLIAEAVNVFRKAYPTSEYLAISSRGGRTQSANAMSAWFWQVYKRMGYKGASSHSGRRFYITTLARIANKHGCSLVDVQKIAGHARLDSTQAYIEFSDNVQALVNSLCDERPRTPRRIKSPTGTPRRMAA